MNADRLAKLPRDGSVEVWALDNFGAAHKGRLVGAWANYFEVDHGHAKASYLAEEISLVTDLPDPDFDEVLPTLTRWQAINALRGPEIKLGVDLNKIVDRLIKAGREEAK